MGGDGFGEEVDGVATWLAASFDDVEQCFDEAAACGAVGAVGEFAPATTLRAWRSARSARLFVGSIPSISVNRQS